MANVASHGSSAGIGAIHIPVRATIRPERLGNTGTMAGQEAVGTRDQGAPGDDRQKARDLPERVERGESHTGKNQSQDMKWPSPVLDYSKIKDGKKPTVVPPRVTNIKPAENITRGTRPNTSPPSKLPRWITTGGSIESRQAEAHDHDGSQEAHWAAHQGEERPRLHESSTCPAQRCVEETRTEPGGKHQGTTTTVSICDGQLRDLRSRVGASFRWSQACDHGDHAAVHTGGRRRQGNQGPRLWTFGWWTGCTHRDRRGQRGRGDDPGCGCHSDHTTPEYTIGMCELPRGCQGHQFISTTTFEITSTGQWTGWRERWYWCQGRRKEGGFMRRRSGNSLAWQSVLTEQDQTRYLRFGDVVEVWEFDVGFDKDFGRYNNYEHYEFFYRPLDVAKTTTGGNRRTGMNTIQALLHGFHHSVREHDDFMDTWMAIASANALHVELRSGGIVNIDNGQMAISAEHDDATPTPSDQPEQRDVPERIPVISTGLHEEDEVEETGIVEADVFHHIQGGVRTVHHLEAAREATTQEYPLIVVTFDLSGKGQGRRDFYSDVLLHDVWQGVRRTWSEYQDIDLHFVEPQPVLTRWPYIVFIVEDRQMRNTGLVPVLLNFRVPADMYNLLWDFDIRAAYFNEGYTVMDNLEENGLEDVCTPRGLRVCQVTFGFDSVPLHDRPRYTIGALCDVDIEEFPGEWRRTLVEFPNFEQMATTIRMLRRENGLAGGPLQCCIHVLDDHGRRLVQSFEIHWTMTQHPGAFMRHLRDQGIECELVAFIWPQPPSSENFHRWMFVGGRHIEAPSSLNFVMVRQRSGGQTFERPFVNNPAESVIELLNALQLPEWCEEHGGLDRYRNHGAFCRRLAHGRRIDLIVDVEEAEEISFTQIKAAPLALRNDDGAPGIEEVIEHYQTHTPHEEAESEADGEQMEGDYDGDTQDEDPPEEPEQPDDEMPQRSSDSDEWTHGMIFRKGHPVASVWTHVESYDEMVTDIASQLSLQPRDILGIHYSQPEPFDISAIARCRGDQYPDTTECLVLVDVFIYNRASVPQEPALFRNVIDLPPLLTRRQLLERAGLEPMCAARRNRCLVKVEGTTIPLQHTGPIFVQHASYVVIRVPPFENEDFNCEAMSLVQTRASLKRKHIEWTHLHLFRYRRQYKRLRVAVRGDTSQWLIDELQGLNEEIVQGLRALHEVHDPPRDLELTRENVFLGEGWGDRGAACQDDDRLTLLDIEIKQSARHWDSHTIRSAFWCRARITRTALLTTLRVHQHCIGDGLQGCYVYLNHVEIQDEAIRHARDGDYFRVVVFGKDRPWKTLQALTAFEEQDRQRRVFGSTSEEMHGQQPSPSNTDYIDRRFRGMSGSDCQHKLILEPEINVAKNAHRPALKDITNTLGGTRVPGLDAAQELRDQERPHVSDVCALIPVRQFLSPD